jgi:peptidoglycan/LPS O-acetylase OafA/YrhL
MSPGSPPGSAHRWLYRNPLCHLPVFVAGLAIAFLLPYVKGWSTRTHQLIQTIVLAYVLGLAAFRGTGAWWSAPSYGAFFIVPFAVVLLSLASDRGWFAGFLATRAMVTLGVASFALYVTHRWFVWQLGTFGAVAKGHGLAPYVGFVVTIAVLLLIAEGAHRYVEEPVRRYVVALGNRLARTSAPRPRPADPTVGTPPRESVGAGI